LRAIVVYDSETGNTEKIAQVIARSLNCDIKKVDEAPSCLIDYELLIIGTPNIGNRPSEKIEKFIQNLKPSKKAAFFVTFGVPFWGEISTLHCLEIMHNLFSKYDTRIIGQFRCPGYHRKYKVYKNRPSKRDLIKAEQFALKLKNFDEKMDDFINVR